jgi:hypothetical protein
VISLRDAIPIALGGDAEAEPLAVCFGRSEDEMNQLAGRLVPDGWKRKDIVDADPLTRCSHLSLERCLFLVAPFIAAQRTRDLRNDGWRVARVPLPAALLLRAALSAQPGQLIAAVVPQSAFTGRPNDARQRLLSVADIHLLIESEGGGWATDLGLHASAPVTLLCVARRADEAAPRPARFFKLPQDQSGADVKAELVRLAMQDGGRTAHGYVVRDVLDSARPLLYSAFDPARQERLADLRNIGEVVVLRDFARVTRGAINTHRHATRLGDAGVPVLSARDIIAAGQIDLTESQKLSQADQAELLQAGDICIAGIQTQGGTLHVKVVEDGNLPLAANQTVLVVRPSEELDLRQRKFLVDYLGSARAAALLAHDLAGGFHIAVDQLAGLHVPLPDETLLSAIDELHGAERQLREWTADVDEAIKSMLGDLAADVSILDLRSTGQLLRQRVAAARQLDEPSYRIRNLFPLPVALPWRRAQTGGRDLESYVAILECAEALTGYLAVLSIMLATELNHKLGSIGTLCEKLTGTTHGASMGDWTAIVREVTGKAVTNRASATTPFVELTELIVDDSRASTVLSTLADMRNDQSHKRGPKGGEIPAAVDDAKSLLEELYEACQWLCDYPVRLISETRWDSYAQEGRYTFQQLIGDHYLVPLQEAKTPISTLNAGALYVVDRADEMHLMSPLVFWHECESCGVPSAFFLDGFDVERSACRMRAMDHNHVITRTDVVGPLAQLGLLRVS